MTSLLTFISTAQLLSHVQLFATLWTIVCPGPLSVGLSRQEQWSGLPFPTPFISKEVAKGIIFMGKKAMGNVIMDNFMAILLPALFSPCSPIVGSLYAYRLVDKNRFKQIINFSSFLFSLPHSNTQAWEKHFEIYLKNSRRSCSGTSKRTSLYLTVMFLTSQNRHSEICKKP